jgi:predicted unusual protein kinase regulating ubiquinone biosynthesis (AarF/ABC1/UbiB family)
MSTTSQQSPVFPARRLRARYRRVLLFFAGAFAHVLFWDILLRRIGFRGVSRRSAPSRYRRIAMRFRLLAASLGGMWIKVGQFLSARLDILPEEITSELSDLQDEVDPQPYEVMEGVLQEEFGDRSGEHFLWIDRVPLASASLGQVHRARLSDQTEVVVKIQRPGIRELIAVDLKALARVLGWLKRYRPISRRANLDALFEEFSSTIWEELDYLQEAENAGRFADMLHGDPGIRVPSVFQEHTTRSVITLEDVYFIKITDYAAIEGAGVDRSEVADRLFRTYLLQIFQEGFFHADPHPGNLFVEPPGTEGWRLVFVDFGMVGHVSEKMKTGLQNLAIAIGTRDEDRLIQAYQDLDVLLPGADLDRIREAERAVFDRYWGMSMRDLKGIDHREMREFAKQFRDLMYEMPFQVPEDIIYLGRCVAILSGMCTGLDPDFNIFEGIRPFAEGLLGEDGGDWLDILLEQLVEQGSALARLPKKLDTALTRLERGEVSIEARLSADFEGQVRRLSRALDRLVWALMFGVFFLTGVLLYTGGYEIPGAISLAVSGLLFILVVMQK